MQAVGSLKICVLISCFCQKYIMFEPKKYKGDACHNTKEWWKIWRVTDFCFEKWHEEFGEFWPKTWKSQNLHFNGIILTKVYNISAKKVKAFCVIVVKINANFEGKMLFHECHEKFCEFHRSTQKFYNLHFERHFCPRNVMLCHDTKGWCNI